MPDNPERNADDILGDVAEETVEWQCNRCSQVPGLACQLRDVARGKIAKTELLLREIDDFLAICQNPRIVALVLEYRELYG